MSTSFAHISSSDWLFRPSMEAARQRTLLSGIPFEEIIDRLLSAPHKIHPEQKPRPIDGYTFYRAVIKLEFENSELVDLFHNASTGYRAQFYASEQNGVEANSFAVEKLVPSIMHAIATGEADKDRVIWFQNSLTGSDVKLWIHQGQWLLFSKKTDRKLQVQRWLAMEGQSMHRRHKRFWWSLTPDQERSIEVKGYPLTPSGVRAPHAGKDSQNRAKAIFDSGYT